MDIPPGNDCYIAIEAMALIEIVDLPNFKMVDLSSSQTVNVYQRVPPFMETPVSGLSIAKTIEPATKVCLW